jgi:hypothetical protein
VCVALRSTYSVGDLFDSDDDDDDDDDDDEEGIELGNVFLRMVLIACPVDPGGANPSASNATRRERRQFGK